MTLSQPPHPQSPPLRATEPKWDLITIRPRPVFLRCNMSPHPPLCMTGCRTKTVCRSSLHVAEEPVNKTSRGRGVRAPQSASSWTNLSLYAVS